MFDTFHANIEEENLPKAFSECAAEIAHIHVAAQSGVGVRRQEAKAPVARNKYWRRIINHHPRFGSCRPIRQLLNS